MRRIDGETGHHQERDLNTDTQSACTCTPRVSAKECDRLAPYPTERDCPCACHSRSTLKVILDAVEGMKWSTHNNACLCERCEALNDAKSAIEQIPALSGDRGAAAPTPSEKAEAAALRAYEQYDGGEEFPAGLQHQPLGHDAMTPSSPGAEETPERDEQQALAKLILSRHRERGHFDGEDALDMADAILAAGFSRSLPSGGQPRTTTPTLQEARAKVCNAFDYCMTAAIRTSAAVGEDVESGIHAFYDALDDLEAVLAYDVEQLASRTVVCSCPTGVSAIECDKLAPYPQDVSCPCLCHTGWAPRAHLEGPLGGMADRDCPCGNPIVRGGIVVLAHVPLAP